MTQPPTTDGKPRLLTVDEAAAQLGISREQLCTFMREGEIAWVSFPPHTKQTGRRVEQAEIDAFIERNRQRATA